MSRQTRWLWLALAVTAGGCAHEGEHEERPHFEVTTPLVEDTELSTEYVCQIRAIQHIEVRAIEAGYLEEIFIDEGQSVAQGQRLFQILPSVYQAEYARDSAEAHRAEIEYQNTRQLRDGNVVSDNQLALAQASMERALAERRLARAHLQFATIRAPFAGIVGRLEVRRGSLLEEGEHLTVLADNHEMWVYFNVSETGYLAFRAEHELGEQIPVRLRLANGEIFEHEGVIQTIEADFNNETGTIEFRAGFPNPDALLRHGETGRVVMSRTVDDAILIPQSATFDVLDHKFVFVVDEEGVVHQRRITVSAQLPHIFIVSDGLAAEDRILLEGLRRVTDGDHISPVERDPAEVRAELALPAE